MVAANCWRYSSNKTIDISFQKLNIVICLLILLLGIHGYCFYSNRMYSSLGGQKKLLLFLLRIILAGAILPASLIEVPRLSRRGRALRGSRWSRDMPKSLTLLTALAEIALRFNGTCRSRFAF